MYSEEKINKLYEKLKQQPDFELRVELGKLLMIHIDDFTPEQRSRYYELLDLLKIDNP